MAQQIKCLPGKGNEDLVPVPQSALKKRGIVVPVYTLVLG